MGPGSEEEEPRERFPPPATAPSGGSEWLWTPWRMRYVAGADREEGCIFCNRLAEQDDVQSLILHRGERAFVIMNLYPYNTGHLMIVPNAHVASPEDADPEVMREMAALRGPVLRALRRALSPDGFNLGLNVGAPAGAGVADHLHEHVVPRWQGDANFMPILACDDGHAGADPGDVRQAARGARRRAGIRQSGHRRGDRGRSHARARRCSRTVATGRSPETMSRSGARRSATRASAARLMPSCWVGPESVTWVRGDPRSSCAPTFPEDTALASGNRLAPVNELLDGKDAQLVRTPCSYRDQFDSC